VPSAKYWSRQLGTKGSTGKPRARAGVCAGASSRTQTHTPAPGEHHRGRAGEKILLLLCLGVMSATVMPGCPTVTCLTTPMATCYNWTVNPTNFTATINPCTAGYYCPAEIVNITGLSSYTPCTNATVPSPSNLITGSYCENGSWCASGVCTSTSCVGLGLNANCTSTRVCNPGLFCNSTINGSTCVTAYGAGAACSDDEECINGYNCYNNVCTKYYSMADETIINTKDYRFCKSGYAVVYNATNGTYQCVTLKSVSSPLHACASDNDCNGAYTVGKVTTIVPGTCMCANSLKPTSYCVPFPGDSYGSKTLSKLKSWVTSSSNIKNCGITGMYYPRGQYCQQRWWSKSDWSSLMYYYWMSENQYQTGNMATCIKDIIMLDYVSIKKSYDKYDSAAYLAVALIFSLVA
jgi:hypothetical protein